MFGQRRRALPCQQTPQTQNVHSPFVRRMSRKNLRLCFLYCNSRSLRDCLADSHGFVAGFECDGGSPWKANLQTLWTGFSL